MDIRMAGYCILLFVLIVEAQNINIDQSLEGHRKARLIERDVSMYPGHNPQPIYCSGEGFRADPGDCKIFYRCMNSGKGKFTIFKFQCAPGTVYDTETEVCNYPRATKRLECGEFSNHSPDINGINEIDEVQQDLPKPITMKVPQYSEQITRDIIESLNYMTTTVPTISFTKTNEWMKITSLTSKLTESPLAPTINHPNSYNLSLPSVTEIVADKKVIHQNNICTIDGFMGDYENCRKFYRCVGNQIGGFIKYEFTCSEPTIWDDDIKACNHIWAVKRSRCAKSGLFADTSKTLQPIAETTSENINFISISDELHKVIQQQTQSSYGSKIIPSQSQTDYELVQQNSNKAFYGDRINTINSPSSHQNQTQISNGLTSQTQNQINYGNNLEQKQPQIDQSKKLSQAQTQMSESTTKKSTSESVYDNEEQHLTQIHSQDINECTQSGFIGDPHNCKIFYRCVDNGKGDYTKYKFFCSDGTLWDRKLEVCNHEWAVKDCWGEYSSQEIKISTSTTRTTKTYPSSTYVLEKNNKTIQNENQNNKDIIYNNKNQSTLTTASFAVMESSTKSTVLNNFPSESSGCRSSGFIGDINNCKIFYRCVDNGRGGYTKYKYECGEGTLWDPEIESCNHAWAVHNNCGGYGASTMKTDSSHHKPTQVYEENNLNYTLQYSTHKMNTTHATTQATSILILKEITCNKTGFVGDNTDCKKFYRCVDNGDGSFIRHEFSCGDGTAWDQNIQACNHAKSVYARCDEGNDTANSDDTSTSHQSTLPILQQNENSQMQNNNNYDDTTKISTIQQTQISNFNCIDSGFYGDKDDCQKFYRCVDDGMGGFIRYEFNCGKGTAWDKNIVTCNHASLVNECSNKHDSPGVEYENSKQITSTSTNNISNEPDKSKEEYYTSTSSFTTSENPTFDTSCQFEGYFGDSNDCKIFYQCVKNGKEGFYKYTFTCGNGTIWNQKITGCDYESIINKCATTVTDYPYTTGYEHLKGNSSTNTILREENETQEYQSTSNPSTLYPQLVTSSMITSIENVYKESGISASNHCTSEGFHGDKTNCQIFYRCVDDGSGKYIRYNFTCGEGTAWDEDINGCNHIHLVARCHLSNINTLETTTTERLYMTTAATIIAPVMSSTESNTKNNGSHDNNCSKEGFFGYISDCKKFYRCVDDGKKGYIKYDFTCGEGTVWDQDINTCNHPQNVENFSCESDTDNNLTTNSFPSSSSSIPSTTTQSLINTSENGEQTSSTSQPHHITSSTKPINNDLMCPQAGFFPNPHDCKKFYRCVDWNGDGSRYSIFHFTCGDGTIWDPALETCNYEESVYPPRNCNDIQSETENIDHEISTTDVTMPQPHESTTSQLIIQPTSTQQITTTEQSITRQSTTKQTDPSEQTTAQQLSTTHKITTNEWTTLDPTTLPQQPTTITTLESTTSQSTTVQENSTHYSTTTSEEPSSLTESTTSMHTTITEQSTTHETTIQPASVSEITTSEQYSTTNKITTQDSTTVAQTISDQTTSDQQPLISTTLEATTPQSTTVQDTTTQYSPTSKQPTTKTESTTNTQITSTQIFSESTSIENTTTLSSTTEKSDRTTDNPISTTHQVDTNESTTTEGLPATTLSNSDNSSTEGNAPTSEDKCPETDENQYLFACPTSFRRHPKYCNMFYQCTEDDDTYDAKIAVFTCPNNTIYDESKVQCIEENKAEKRCHGQIASRRRVKRLGNHYKEPIVVTRDSHMCTVIGHLPFEKNSECSPAFMKCEKSKSGKLRGFVYLCPQNYIYWSISRKCERKENVKDCKRSINNWNGRWEIPIEKRNVAW